MFDFLSDITKTIVSAPVNLGISTFNLALDTTKVIIPQLDTESVKLKHIELSKKEDTSSKN